MNAFFHIARLRAIPMVQFTTYLALFNYFQPYRFRPFSSTPSSTVNFNSLQPKKKNKQQQQELSLFTQVLGIGVNFSRLYVQNFIRLILGILVEINGGD